MNWNQQRKIPFYFPLSVCLLVLHVVVAPQKVFFFSRLPPTVGRKLAEQEEVEWVPQQH